MKDSATHRPLLSQDTYFALFMSAPDAILVVDATGTIVEVNPQAERMFGYAAAELLDQKIECLVPDRFRGHHPGHRSAYAHEPAPRPMGSGLDLWGRHKSGTEFPVEISLSPLRYEDRSLVSAAVRDVTESRRARDELRKTRDELEVRVSERTAELEAQVEETKQAVEQLRAQAAMRQAAEESLRQAQKMEAVGQLTGGIAHDFNNLLTIIMANLQMLEEELVPQSLPADLAAAASRAAQRGADLTRKLLVFARRQRLEAAPVNVNELVSGMTGMLGRTLGEHIRIVEHLAAGLPDAIADLAQLETALLNLAVNARDAMPQGGQLSIESSAETITDTDRRLHGGLEPGAYVCIVVSDTGTGMPPEVLSKAFEPFYTTKEAGKGTGLGLSMVYGFARQSGGYVNISSEVGRGSSVKMYLPEAIRAESTTTAKQATDATGAETILLVEDDAEVRAATRRLLLSLGYRVVEAESAETAMVILAGEPAIDLLFTDVVLAQGESGPELAGNARMRWPELKVLFMSGYVRDTVAFREQLERDAHFLSKPFRKQELAEKLRAALGPAKTH